MITETIGGVDYEIIEPSQSFSLCYVYDNCDNLKRGQAFYYYDKIVYRTKEGKLRSCYSEDHDNSWEI